VGTGIDWRGELGSGAVEVDGRAGASGPSCSAEAVRNFVRLTTESADGRPEDLEQFALLLALLGISALGVLVRDVDRRTVVQVVVTAALTALAVGGAVSAIL
jgi:hypothetical protein